MMYRPARNDFASEIDTITSAQDLEDAIHATTLADAQLFVSRAAIQLQHAHDYYAQQGNAAMAARAAQVEQALLAVDASTDLPSYQAALYGFQQTTVASLYRAESQQPWWQTAAYVVGGSVAALWVWDALTAAPGRRDGRR